jgi:type I restriction enzyme, S subunit
MAASWRTGTVMELQAEGILLVEDGNHGEARPRPDEFNSTGVHFIRAADMDNGRVLFGSASRINEVARQRIVKGIGAPGDVLLSHKGTVGKIALVPDDAPPFVCSPQTTFWRVKNERVLDRRYLHAFMRSPAFHRQLATRAGETDMAPYVSLTSQRGLTVAFPPIAEQRRVAGVIAALDDKIELNRKMNETLEAMARALFKSWFVDFDPVSAKAEGRPPSGMDAETAKLFPSEFVESELGPIPTGWRHVPVSDVCAGLFDGPHATPPESDSGAVFLGIRNFTGTSLDFGDIRRISDSDYANWTKRVVPRSGDIVFTYEATLGFFAIIPVGLRCCLGRRTALVRPRTDAADGHYLFHWFVAPPFQEHLRAHRQPGSTVDRIWLKDFPSYPVLQPPSELVKCFDARVAPIWRRIHSNQEQSTALAQLRDELLPRLLSGDLRMVEAKAAAGVT